VSCAGQDVALADAGIADWEIDVKNEVIHIKAGIIQRSIGGQGFLWKSFYRGRGMGCFYQGLICF
jgi:hypothetical protein